jgi:hypothetical protein
MKPEKKITATMNTTPATTPTQAAARVALERRGSSRMTGAAVATGAVAGSDGVGLSLMVEIMQTVLMCPSCIGYESAMYHLDVGLRECR